MVTIIYGLENSRALIAKHKIRTASIVSDNAATIMLAESRVTHKDPHIQACINRVKQLAQEMQITLTFIWRRRNNALLAFADYGSKLLLSSFTDMSRTYMRFLETQLGQDYQRLTILNEDNNFDAATLRVKGNLLILPFSSQHLETIRTKMPREIPKGQLWLLPYFPSSPFVGRTLRNNTILRTDHVKSVFRAFPANIRVHTMQRSF